MRMRIVLAIVCFAATARADFHEFKQLPVDPSIDLALRRTADATLKAFPKLTAENLALTVIDVTKPDVLSRADYHGDAPFYPASVIKLFFMTEVYHQHKENDPDVPRALKEMIGVSDNDATAFLLDTISDTCSGPELEGRALRKFIDKRRVVNRYFNPMGYDVSAMAKPWSFGPFGRDMQLMGGPDRPNRNRATSNSVASLILWTVRRRAVSPAASDAMLALMQRELKMTGGEEDQVSSFIGEALPAGTKLWSKAGWTSEVRHDSVLVELPGGRRLIMVIFTRGTADDKTLLPAITKTLLGELSGAQAILPGLSIHERAQSMRAAFDPRAPDPSVFVNVRHQPCANRVFANVLHLLHQVLTRTDDAIEVLGLPDAACGGRGLVDQPRGNTFHSPHDRGESCFVWREDQVDVIGHDDCAVEPICELVIVNAACEGDISL